MTSVVLAGPNEDALTRSAYPAFTAAGYRVVAVVTTPQQLRDVVNVSNPQLVVVEADLASTVEEALALLSTLGDADLTVILPAIWEGERERFSQLPHLVAGFTAPAAWPDIVRRLIERCPPAPHSNAQAQPRKEKPQRSLPPQRQGNTRGQGTGRRRPGPRGPRVRLGFWGLRGGVGVSTTALAAAQTLSAESKRVALFDATARGDLHLMLGLQPSKKPISIGNITLFLGQPTEQVVQDFDAVIVDGGRVRGDFNAEWVPLSKPPDENRVRQLVGLEPVRETEWGLHKFISIKVTD